MTINSAPLLQLTLIIVIIYNEVIDDNRFQLGRYNWCRSAHSI